MLSITEQSSFDEYFISGFRSIHRTESAVTKNQLPGDKSDRDWASMSGFDIHDPETVCLIYLILMSTSQVDYALLYYHYRNRPG